MKKPELLAPAGNLEKLKIAIIYGADAVYLGGENFGLRAGAKNFSFSKLPAGANNSGFFTFCLLLIKAILVFIYHFTFKFLKIYYNDSIILIN